MQTVEDNSLSRRAAQIGEPATALRLPAPFPSLNAARICRILAVVALLSLVLAATGMLFFTERGQILLHNPRLLRGDVNRFVSLHPIAAPFFYMSTYLLLGVLALPIWWLQILAGMAFGLPIAVLYTQLSATLAAALAARFSHWLAADWFHRLEGHLVRLRALDEAFGKNGLLVVMAVRLCHVLPFGISNYAFGLTTMRARDIALGTLLGGLPAVTTYVAMGTGGRPLTDWRFVTGLVVLNAILIVPLAVQYLYKRES